MIGSAKGFAALLVKHCRSLGHSQDISTFHCIVHQEVLCAKAAGMADVMSVTVKLVNTILARPLNHRLFRELCEVAEADYGDLLYHTEVRWLSRGNVLKRVFALREEIVAFIRERGLTGFDSFTDETWLCRLAFLTDISSHLNDLNTQLQGRNKLITCMESSVRAFCVKLQLWEKQLRDGNYSYFPYLSQCDSALIDTDECLSVLTSVKGQFSSRFSDVRAQLEKVKIVTTPFEVSVDDLPSEIQMEMIELQASDFLLSKFKSASGLPEFYKQLPCEQFPGLLSRARRVFAIFGSTYACEQLFSQMKFCKNRLRSRLTNEHLNDVLLLSCSSQKPDIKAIASDKQHQISH